MSGYQWEFLDENDFWIEYGRVSTGNDAACRVNISSGTLELQFAKYPNSKIQFWSQKHIYTLDFTTMKQTNLLTRVTRDVRRVRDPFRCDEHIHENRSNEVMIITNLSYQKLLLIPNGPMCSTVPIAPGHAEYSRVVGLLLCSLSCYPRSIFKINNPYLINAFENKRAQLQNQNSNVQYEVKCLFHGTSSSNVTSIAEENIDWRLHGTKIGQLYGRGAYFASNACNSRLYGDAIFICHVLVGLTATGSPDTIKPPKDRFNRTIDTTVDNTANPTVFVKYDSQEYYPVYYALF
ncbi:protein mono-ADP-ribosyltransferase PARP12-like [Hyalella azteca]|uniref:Poly [ADP-ribose] polymerase n=1 Tax=Hyalella azteca TaxID=294128 RepID=A0A979FQT1_HYAAZ|nr:protein mono-ADP-ribosyltransferase PARP12-like [Hyalella azteca]